MELLLLRHAEAVDKDAGGNDFDRVLTPKGEKHAHRVGRLLAHRDLRPDLVVSSPAPRALQTAQIACQEMGVPPAQLRQDETLYENDVPDLLDAIRRHAGQARRLMLVGHDPSFSVFASLLGNTHVSVGKGEAIWFDGVKEWATIGSGPLRLRERLDA